MVRVLVMGKPPEVGQVWELFRFRYGGSIPGTHFDRPDPEWDKVVISQVYPPRPSMDSGKVLYYSMKGTWAIAKLDYFRD